MRELHQCLRVKNLSLQARYTKAILSLSFVLLSLAKWVETIYEVAALSVNGLLSAAYRSRNSLEQLHIILMVCIFMRRDILGIVSWEMTH